MLEHREIWGLSCFSKAGSFSSYRALADCLEQRYAWAQICSETLWEFHYSRLGLLWETIYLQKFGCCFNVVLEQAMSILNCWRNEIVKEG